MSSELTLEPRTEGYKELVVQSREALGAAFSRQWTAKVLNIISLGESAGSFMYAGGKWWRGSPWVGSLVVS